MSTSSSPQFKGFSIPRSNYSMLPHAFIDLMGEDMDGSELKVTIYILRHTWGYQEFDLPKRITIDEFCNGRKKKDGTRMDKGTGLSDQSVRNGLEAAIKRGTVVMTEDATDKGRIKRYYSPRMELGVQLFDPSTQNLDPTSEKLDPVQRKKPKERKSNTRVLSPQHPIRPLVPDMPADLTEEEQFEWQLRRVVNLIDFQHPGTGALAEAFMRTRGILFMEKDVKEQRNIALDLIKQKVKPEHVIEATKQIMGLKDKDTGRPYTCTSLKHIKNTAISLANPAPGSRGQRNGNGEENGGWVGTNPL